MRGETQLAAEIELVLANANSNAGRNVYLAQDAAWTRAEASALRPEAREAQPLWAFPFR